MKIEAKNQNSLSTTYWQYCCAHSSKISEIVWKRREPIRFEKDWQWTDGRRTARHQISSTDNVSSGAKKWGYPTIWLVINVKLILTCAISPIVVYISNKTFRTLTKFQCSGYRHLYKRFDFSWKLFYCHSLLLLRQYQCLCVFCETAGKVPLAKQKNCFVGN